MTKKEHVCGLAHVRCMRTLKLPCLCPSIIDFRQHNAVVMWLLCNCTFRLSHLYEDGMQLLSGASQKARGTVLQTSCPKIALHCLLGRRQECRRELPRNQEHVCYMWQKCLAGWYCSLELRIHVRHDNNVLLFVYSTGQGLEDVSCDEFEWNACGEQLSFSFYFWWCAILCANCGATHSFVHVVRRVWPEVLHLNRFIHSAWARVACQYRGVWVIQDAFQKCFRREYLDSTIEACHLDDQSVFVHTIRRICCA